jgi:hypothetical protein
MMGNQTFVSKHCFGWKLDIIRSFDEILLFLQIVIQVFVVLGGGRTKDPKEILPIMAETECKAATCSNILINNKRLKCKKVVINGIFCDKLCSNVCGDKIPNNEWLRVLCSSCNVLINENHKAC